MAPCIMVTNKGQAKGTGTSSTGEGRCGAEGEGPPEGEGCRAEAWPWSLPWTPCSGGRSPLRMLLSAATSL